MGIFEKKVNKAKFSQVASFAKTKATLIQNINDGIKLGKPYKNIKENGENLYALLREHGLNEQEKLSIDRLVRKADLLFYDKKYEEAYPLLKVLESQLNWITEENHNKLYLTNNRLEAILITQFDNKKFEILWKVSPACWILDLLAKCEINMGEMKIAENTVNRFLNVNPTSFSAKFLYAQLVKNRINEYEKRLLDAMAYAYSPDHLALVYKELGEIHHNKSNLDVACCLLKMSTICNPTTETEYMFKQLYLELQNVNGKSAEFDDETVINTLNKEKIPTTFSKEVYISAGVFYSGVLSDKNTTKDEKSTARELFLGITQNEELAKEIEHIAKENE